MRLNLNKIKKWALTIIGIFSLGLTYTSGLTYADGYGITMSPMNQKVILTPGEKYVGTFNISNSKDNKGDFKYKVTVEPFFVDEDYNVYFEETDDLNEIVGWTTTDIASGVLSVGNFQKINFTIDVPENAPAGGQYVAIVVSSDNDDAGNDDQNDAVGLAMKQGMGMAHVIYAEIAGTTRRSGELINTSIPSFLFDGNITAESTLKNTGNTHGTATYKMQVFPLFSSEEVYTNEENPENKTILPNRVLTYKSVWDETPAIGIFNVKYTVEFEGVTTEVNKLVIKCPLWLLFIIIFIIVAIVTWLVVRARGRKKTAEKSVDIA